MFIWLLLFNYLLVVGATNVQTTNTLKYTQPPTTEKLPYQHANNCQARFYLQPDCFEQCNDTVQISHPADTLPLQVALLQISGVDFHQPMPLFWLNINAFLVEKIIFAAQNPEIRLGFISINYLPPNLV